MRTSSSQPAEQKGDDMKFDMLPSQYGMTHAPDKLLDVDIPGSCCPAAPDSLHTAPAGVQAPSTHPLLWCSRVHARHLCCPAANDVQRLAPMAQAGQRPRAPGGAAVGAAALATPWAAWHVLKVLLKHHKLRKCTGGRQQEGRMLSTGCQWRRSDIQATARPSRRVVML